MGSGYLCLWYLIIKVTIYLLLRALNYLSFGKLKCLESLAARVRKDLFWNSFMFLLKCLFIELLLATFLAVFYPVYKSTFDLDHMNSGEVASFLSAVITLQILVLILPGMLIWI